MNGRTLAVPDIHERSKRLDQIQPLIDEASRVVVFGDLGDTFSKDKRAGEVARWVKERLDDDKFTFLIGNHDAHYAFRHHFFKCSGYSPVTQGVFDNFFTQADWAKFKVFTHIEGFLASHAGFTKETLHFADEEKAEYAIQTGLAGGFHAMFAPGIARGGWNAIGGPTWLDWNREFEPIKDTPQIVGHTVGTEVRQKGNSYCIDTGFKHVVWVDANGIEVVNLN